LFDKPERLSIAFGVCHAAVPVDGFPQVPPLLVADNRYRYPIDKGNAAYQRGVVAEAAVAVQLDEVIKNHIDIIEGARTVVVPGEFNLPPYLRNCGTCLQLFGYRF